MMQKQSMVRLAAAEFSRGNYLKALDLYRGLSKSLGDKNFHANVLLCERRLLRQGRRDCSQLPLKSIKMACVMDEFTFQCYEPECDLLALSPDMALAELEAFQPDVLFIESAWRGKDELWHRKVGGLSQELRAVLRWSKERQVPTVFWNKEDPVHFETFLATAREFDFVFTTDIDCISRYKAALGHDRVFLLPFACQPKLHNPIETYSRKDAFCFAGAYYVRYPDRTRDLENYVAHLPSFKPLEIFDRNFGKGDSNYQFPPEYQPYIVGTLPFNEIDKAYKGYRYSINLNSIKQSQTMFARRVFELLGSNTITVSNFSRGVRLLFGDLVVTSDNGSELVARLKLMDWESEQKQRLAALRKVMQEHTYAHRLGVVARKVLGWKLRNEPPEIVVVAAAASAEEYIQVVRHFRSQQCQRKRLIVVARNAWTPVDALSNDELVLDESEAVNLLISSVVESGAWLGLMNAADYYGPNYLQDMALATTYSDADAIGKAEYYLWTDGRVHLAGAGQAYAKKAPLLSRASIVSMSSLSDELTVGRWLQQMTNQSTLTGQAIDPFNYCVNGDNASNRDAVCARVNDAKIDSGLSIDDLIRDAEQIPADEYHEAALPRWSGSRLAQLFGPVNHPALLVSLIGGELCIESTLADEKHEYVYSRDEIPIAELVSEGRLLTHLDASPGLDIQYVFVFYKENKERLSHVIHSVNRNQSVAIPEGAASARLGWRIRGGGETRIRCLQWGHRSLDQAYLLGRSDKLVLTNHYPSYDNLYRNGFVHTRVKSYLDHGTQVDVFRMQPVSVTSFHEFQNVDVTTGDEKALEKLLSTKRYRHVLVHFLTPEMWAVLQRFSDLKVTVWIHGSEIQPWYRRDYNYQNDQERAKAMRESEVRMEFWRGLLQPMPANLKLVFVSRYFAEEVFEDVGFRVPEDSYKIIHNPIDTELFSYQEKHTDQRRRVLSIRPYASRKYANDLSVKAILKLSEKPYFNDIEFCMIGDGKLFDETLAPLRKFRNVKIERRFLTHGEIAAIHKDYGICLTPTRMDAQGVSRDEAMASGLVPISNAVAAIPEFMDESCGILADSEDAEGLAAGIEAVYKSPSRFAALSAAAAARVRRQSAKHVVVWQELALFTEGIHA
ncbi:glycosyltransferase family protein [Bordetella pseudohinzii]|nr:glycosyltransferase [Bordetella pseudohinzii]